jgi:WD40 repeat protein
MRPVRIARFPLLGALLVLLFACSDKGNELRNWLHEDTGSYASVISDDGKYLLTGAIGGYGRVWDVDKGEVRYSVQHEDSDEGGIVAAEFSQDGLYLVTIEQQSIARWRVSSGKLVGYWQWPDLRDVAISANGRYALIGMKASQAIYFDMQAGKMVYVFPHHEKITSVALSADGRFALTGADDWHASLWNLANGEYIWSKNMEYKIAHVELSDDGELAFANASVGKARIFQTDAGGSLVSTLDIKPRGLTVVSADFSDDGTLLATGRAARGIDIWDVKSGKNLRHWLPEVKHKVQPDAATILDLKLLADNTQLLSESSTGIGQLWSIKGLR